MADVTQVNLFGQVLNIRDPISQQAAEEATQTANEAKAAVANATKVSYDGRTQSLVFRQEVNKNGGRD